MQCTKLLPWKETGSYFYVRSWEPRYLEFFIISQKTSNHASYNNCIYGRYRGGLCPFYMININISKCIAFYGGWDCGMVANSARWIFEGGELGYDDYYTIYSNNIPITWLLYKLYCFSSGMKAYPYNPEFIWIQFQCVMLSLAVLCSVLLVLRVSKTWEHLL